MRPILKKWTHNKCRLTEVKKDNYATKKVKTDASSAAGMCVTALGISTA